VPQTRLQPREFADGSVDERPGARLGQILPLAPGRSLGLDRPREIAVVQIRKP
jgi:hypothetical protein